MAVGLGTGKQQKKDIPGEHQNRVCDLNHCEIGNLPAGKKKKFRDKQSPMAMGKCHPVLCYDEITLGQRVYNPFIKGSLGV